MSTRFAQYQVGLAPEPDSFWRENVIAVVILLRECRSGRVSYWRKQVIEC